MSLRRRLYAFASNQPRQSAPRQMAGLQITIKRRVVEAVKPRDAYVSALAFLGAGVGSALFFHA